MLLLVSCQSMHDIQALLSRDLYTRWIDYGTLYASTHHSFVAISTSDCQGYLIDYFLNIICRYDNINFNSKSNNNCIPKLC